MKTISALVTKELVPSLYSEVLSHQERFHRIGNVCHSLSLKISIDEFSKAPEGFVSLKVISSSLEIVYLFYFTEVKQIQHFRQRILSSPLTKAFQEFQLQFQRFLIRWKIIIDLKKKFMISVLLSSAIVLSAETMQPS